MSVPAPCGLARLPEELVDLVLSFVRLFEAQCAHSFLDHLPEESSS